MTIVPGKRKNHLGQVMLGRAVVRKSKAKRGSKKSKDEVNAALISTCAGGVCEAHMTGKAIDPSSIGADAENLWAMVSAFLFDADESTKLRACGEIVKMARSVMTEPKVWDAVTAVAEALIAQSWLSGAEVRRIVLAALS